MENLFKKCKHYNLLKSEGGPLCGVIIAGSGAYKQGLYHSMDELNDLDILFITANKENFITLFNDELNNLKSAVGIDVEECPVENFRKVLTPLYWDQFDAVRFSGFSTSGQKITVKLIDIEFIKGIVHLNDTRVKMLSYKRVSTLYRVLDDGFSILTIGSLDTQIDIDEGNVLNVLNQFLFWKIDKRNLVLGVFTDMILSGQTLYDCNYNITAIKTDLVHKISRLVPCQNWLNLLFRISVMPENYLRKLMISYSQRDLCIKNVDEIAQNFCLRWKICILNNDSKLLDHQSKNHFIASNKNLISNTQQLVLEYVNVTNLDFPTAHRFGKAFVNPKEFYFFKETTNFVAEIFGFNEAKKYFSNIHATIQTLKERNICLYKWVFGDSLASTRMQFIMQSWETKNIFGLIHPYQYNLKSNLRIFLELITEIELLRASRMLNAYKCSKTIGNVSGIHKVFYNRFIENRFLNNYKNDIFKIGSKKMAIDTIMSLPLVINGKKYNHLSYYIEKAKNSLSYQSLENDLNDLGLSNSFGLGDTHCGNIMILKEPDILKNKFIFIDYECAGYHSPFLDICKGFSVDVLFNVYQLDVLVNLSKDELVPYDLKICMDEVDNNLSLFIEHKFVLDWVSYFAFQAKFQGILNPLLKDLQGDRQKLRAWEIFQSGVFCSLLFAKKFPMREQLFLMIALAVELINANCEDLNEILKPML